MSEIIYKMTENKNTLNQSRIKKEMNPQMISGGWTPKDRIEIFKINENGGEKEKILESNNTATFVGRALNLRRMFDISDGTSLLADSFIYWYGLGDGGVGNDPLDPIPPSANSTNLESEIWLAENQPTFTDFRLADGTSSLAYYKAPILISIEDDPDNYNERLIAKVEFTLGTDVCQNRSFSEAGLFAANTRTSGPSGPNADNGDLTLCARVTFPRVNKGLAETYSIIWWLRF